MKLMTRIGTHPPWHLSYQLLQFAHQLHPSERTVEVRYGNLLQDKREQIPMKIRIRVNQPACAHQVLTLKGRYLTLKGRHLRRSRERYTCNACGARVVRTLNTSVSDSTPDHHVTEINPSSPFDIDN